MITMFLFGSAEGQYAPKYDAIVSIQKPSGAPSIPGLRVMRGELPEVYLTKGGSLWTDCLTPTLSHLPLVVSERVWKAVHRHGLTGLELMEVACVTQRSPKLRGIEHGRYFQATPYGTPPQFTYRVFERVSGRYLFRFETTDKENDPRCKDFFLPHGFIPHTQRVPLQATADWDFMKVPDTANGMLVFGMILCSRRVVEIARDEGWTNFNFSPVDRLGTCIGDFRERPWPPEQWYPEDHPAEPSVGSS
jgi:hypothetical protein